MATEANAFYGMHRSTYYYIEKQIKVMNGAIRTVFCTLCMVVFRYEGEGSTYSLKYSNYQSSIIMLYMKEVFGDAVIGRYACLRV